MHYDTACTQWIGGKIVCRLSWVFALYQLRDVPYRDSHEQEEQDIDSVEQDQKERSGFVRRNGARERTQDRVSVPVHVLAVGKEHHLAVAKGHDFSQYVTIYYC